MKNTASTPAAKPRMPSRPRDYAALIVEAAGNVARQREIFESCPLEWRAQARSLAKRALDQAEKVLTHKRLIRSAIERDTTPHAPSPRISDLPMSRPEVGWQRLAELRAALGQKEPA